MVKDNLINLVNNKKPVELVQEIDNKYEVPSFEEFMKNYESNGSLNYDDLSSSDVGEVEGYGPCIDGRDFKDCHCSSEELQRQIYWKKLNLLSTNNDFGTISNKNKSKQVNNQSFRFEVTADRGKTCDDWYKYIESKPNDHGGGLEVSSFLQKVDSANLKSGGEGKKKYSKTAGVLLENIGDAKMFLEYLTKEYLRINGRHGSFDSRGHNSLKTILKSYIESYNSGNSVNYMHINRK